jgi:hypothetical protein
MCDDVKFLNALRNENNDFNMENIDVLNVIYNGCFENEKMKFSNIRKSIKVWRDSINVDNLQLNKNRKDNINYWIFNAYSEYQSKILALKNSKGVVFENFEHFVSFIKEREDCKNINYDNIEYLQEYYNFMKDGCYTVVKMFNKLRDFVKLKRTKRGSPVSKEFWVSYGWNFTDEELEIKLKTMQRERSIWSDKYWKNQGMCDDIEIKNIISDYQKENSRKMLSKYTKDELSKRCHFGRKYWLDRGLSEEEVEIEIRKVNPSCVEFYENIESYHKRLNDISNELKIRWVDGVYDNAFDNGKNQSMEEINFFEYISDIEYIKHIPFFMCIKNLNNTRYVYDGYYKEIEGEIILIEYDGLFHTYHIKEEDDIRDENVFKNRKDIIGIIRVSNIYYKKIKEKIKKEIYESIEKIKNKKYQTIRLY